MYELIKITQNENQEPCISGRELHGFLEVGTDYKKWFDRMREYGFAENVDFSTVSQKCPIANGGYQEKFDHMLKLDMAKELAMIQRTEKGKQARQYFIQVEKEYNSPEKIMARALMIAQKEISTLNVQVGQLEAKVEEQKPKVLFAESVEASKSSCLIGELAKILRQNGVNIGQNRLFQWMRANGYLGRMGERYNIPTQKSMDMELMTIKKNVINQPDGSVRTTTTTKITGKGQVYFVNKFLSDEAL